MEKIDILIDGLAGKHGPVVREKAELAVKVAADQITRAIFGVPDCAFEIGSTHAFSTGGHVTRGEQLVPGAGDREHFVPLSIIEHLRLSHEDDL